MYCYYCNNPLPDESRYCNVCGSIVAVFNAPEGFELDPASRLYYQSVDVTDPATGNIVLWVTWFDPHSGEYQQFSYPVSQNQEQLPEAVMLPEEEQLPEAAMLPEDEQLPEAAILPEKEQNQEASASLILVPDGFVFDPSSGLYYIATPGNDLSTGAPGHWYTYFYPSSGDYQQIFYATQDVENSGYYQTGGNNSFQDLQSEHYSQPEHHSKKDKNKNKKSLLPVFILIITALLAVSVLVLWRLDFLPFLDADDSADDAEVVMADAQPDSSGGMDYQSHQEEDQEESKEGFDDPESYEEPNGYEEPNSYEESSNYEEIYGYEEPISDEEPDNEQYTETLTGSGEGVTVTLDKYYYGMGDSMEVTVEGITDEMYYAAAFAAIYESGADHIYYQEYQYPDIGIDTLYFTAPYPGDYEMRFYKEDYNYSDEALVLSIPFTVDFESAYDVEANEAAAAEEMAAAAEMEKAGN